MPERKRKAWIPDRGMLINHRQLLLWAEQKEPVGVCTVG